MNSFSPGVGTVAGATATPVANSSGNVAAAAANAVLPGVAGKTTYIEGFDLTGYGATAASIILVTITGLAAQIGTLTFEVVIPAGVTTQIGANNAPVSYRFPTPLPAAGLNSAITVNVPSFGAGNTNACCTAYGVQA
jgi:hypothetical protein